MSLRDNAIAHCLRVEKDHNNITVHRATSHTIPCQAPQAMPRARRHRRRQTQTQTPACALAVGARARRRLLTSVQLATSCCTVQTMHVYSECCHKHMSRTHPLPSTSRARRFFVSPHLFLYVVTIADNNTRLHAHVDNVHHTHTHTRQLMSRQVTVAVD
jgi:hypothetical protein